MSKIINIPLAENIIDFTPTILPPLKARTALVSGGKDLSFFKENLPKKRQSILSSGFIRMMILSAKLF